MPRLLPLLVLLCLLSPPAAADTAVDVELVLAVDASGSVDDGEFRLQLDGIAAALTDATVLRAIAAGREGRIAVNLVVWAEARYPKDTSGWMIVASPEDAKAAAAVIAAFPRRQTGGTGIGDGVAHAIRSLATNGIAAPRQVVDVSGDGEETTPRDYVVTIAEARAMAAAHGVTVNGLAIENEVPGLAEWYRDHVQIGADSFVMAAADYADFARAMRQKLLREIDPGLRLSRR
jgi:hypothetical protein